MWNSFIIYFLKWSFSLQKKGKIRKKVLYFGSTSQCNAKHFSSIRCKPPWIEYQTPYGTSKLMSILLQFCLISNMRLSKSRMLSLWWFTHQISNSTCGRALSCFGIGWQILQIDFLWSTGAFSDSGVGARLGNFWKNRVWVRQGAAIKNLIKIFLFLFSIYFKGKNIFLFWESMQTTFWP